MNWRELLVVFMLSICLAFGAGILVDAIVNQPPCEPTPDTSWHPPNVQLCPDDIGLWECIRTVAYREDI